MTNRNILTEIYSLYEQWANAFEFACHKGCTTCCTQSVTMTTLEGELIHEYIIRHRPELIPILGVLPLNSPVPVTTTNQFASACLRGEDILESSHCWNLTPCVFLIEGCCTIYPVRAFMCRSFGSRVRCAEQGAAEIEPLLLTLNTIIMQCIEHLDRNRPWGNMNTILRRLEGNDSCGQSMHPDRQLLSQPLPGFLLLPEEKAALEEHLRTLLHLLHLLNEYHGASSKP